MFDANVCEWIAACESHYFVHVMHIYEIKWLFLSFNDECLILVCRWYTNRNRGYNETNYKNIKKRQMSYDQVQMSQITQWNVLEMSQILLWI